MPSICGPACSLLIPPLQSTTTQQSTCVFGRTLTLKQLEDPSRHDHVWLFLSHVLGTFSVPDELRPTLKEVLLRTDFGEFITRDKRLGLIALYQASVQSLNLRDDELAARLVTSWCMLLARYKSGLKPRAGCVHPYRSCCKCLVERISSRPRSRGLRRVDAESDRPVA